LLGDGEIEAGEGEVVIGGEEGDQAEDEAAQGLEDPWRIEAQPAEMRCW